MALETGTWVWAVPTSLAERTDDIIRVVSAEYPRIFGQSAAGLSLKEPRLVVDSPDGAENWTQCSTHQIELLRGGCLPRRLSSPR